MSKSLYAVALLLGLVLGFDAAAEQLKTLRTADAWKPQQWMRAKGEVIPSANIPAEGKIEGLDESIQIKIDYSGKGFEFWGIEPRKKQVKPITGLQSWVCTDIEGYYWMAKFNDTKGKGTYQVDGKEQKYEAGMDLAEDWYLWEWEKPEDWPKIRFANITSHNWGNDKVPATVSVFLYDFTVISEDQAAK